MILYPLEVEVSKGNTGIFAIGNILPSKEAGAILLHRIEVFTSNDCVARLYAIASIDISETKEMVSPLANSSIGSPRPIGADAILFPNLEKPDAVQLLKVAYVEKNKGIVLADEKDGIAIAPGFFVVIMIQAEADTRILGNVLCQNQLKQG